MPSYFPLQLDIAPKRSSAVNRIFVMLVIATYGVAIWGDLPFEPSAYLIEDKSYYFSAVSGAYAQIQGYLLLVNLLMLWVLGNAICGKIGGYRYAGLALLLCALGSIASLYLFISPLVWVEFAMYAIFGLFFCFYPNNLLSSPWLQGRFGGDFHIPMWCIIGIWLLIDSVMSLNGANNGAHVVYLVGLLTGVIIGWILLLLNGVVMTEVDRKTLPEYFGVSVTRLPING